MERELVFHKLSYESFLNWKSRTLDTKLDDESLHNIKTMFGLQSTDDIVAVNCNESHAHEWTCLDIQNRYSAVVLRLLYEIEEYRKRFDSIRDEANYKKR
jgi:hypothetical protein